MPTDSLKLNSLRRDSITECILSGYTVAETAEELGISVKTVSNYRYYVARYYCMPLGTPVTPYNLLLYMLKPYIGCVYDVTHIRGVEKPRKLSYRPSSRYSDRPMIPKNLDRKFDLRTETHDVTLK